MSYEIIPQGDYILIHMVGECTGDEEAKNILHAFQEVMAIKPLKYLIFQMSECSHITPPVLRDMSLIYKQLKGINGSVRVVGASEKILNQIKAQGLDRILLAKMSLRGALVDFGLAKEKQLDVNFINPFLAATQKVFRVQCFLEATPQKPELKKPTDPLLMGDVSGIISISSETFNGTLAISLTEKIFIKIGTAMLGEPMTEINEKNVDLVGELANIVLGQAKLELSKLGYGIQMALPSCVWGKDHKIKHFGGGTCVVIPYATSEGTFYTEVMTEQLVNTKGSNLSNSRSA